MVFVPHRTQKYEVRGRDANILHVQNFAQNWPACTELKWKNSAGFLSNTRIVPKLSTDYCRSPLKGLV